MYNRQFCELPEKLVIDGVPQFGTYKTCPQKLDIPELLKDVANLYKELKQ